MKEILVSTGVGTIALLFAVIPVQKAGKPAITYFGGFCSVFAGYGLGEFLRYLAGLV